MAFQPNPFGLHSSYNMKEEGSTRRASYEDASGFKTKLKAKHGERKTIGRLSKHYYTENIFAIPESDNPFALSASGLRKSRLKERENWMAGIEQLFSSRGTGNNQTPQWFFFVSLSLLAALALVMSGYRSYFMKNWKAFRNSNIAGQLFREQQGWASGPNLLLQGLFVSSMGSLLFIAFQKLSMSPFFRDFTGLLLCIAAVLGLYFFKHIQMYLLARIFPFETEVNYHDFSLSTFSKVLGVLLVPCVFLVAYGPIELQPLLAKSSLALAGSVLAFSYLRGMSAARNRIIFHKFHFFIYLCTVEIAPFLILGKLAMG